MKMDYSWEYSAREYIKLYERAIGFKTKKNPRDKSLEYILG